MFGPMTHLRPFEPARLLLCLFVTLAGTLCGASALAGQDAGEPSPSLGNDGAVAGELRLAPTIGVIHGSPAGFLRASALLHVSERLAIGGEAVLSLTRVRTTPPSSTDRSELSVRYGGIVASFGRPGAAPSDPWSASLLVGTGTARVHSSLLDTEIGTDNFLVLEPAVERDLGPLGRLPLNARVRASWRLPLGLESLPSVTQADLRGFSLGVSLGVRRDPRGR